MLKKRPFILNRVPKRLIILALMAGLAYLILPRIASLAGVGQPPANAAVPNGERQQPSLAGRIEGATPVNPEIAAAITDTLPLSPSITATPTPTKTPTPPGVAPYPANQATAEYQAALATANAWLNDGAATSTAAVANTAAPRLASMALVIVTSTPTPKNMMTAAARAAQATAVATAIGTYTPAPVNWIAPVVITPPPSTPIPANAATAAFQVAEATAAAFVNGTPTPAPFYVWTATPTPYMRPVSGGVATPWLPPTATPTPLPIPRDLVGKIIFLSNRSGGPKPLDHPLVYAVDPDGGNLMVLTGNVFYKTALARDLFSGGQQYRAVVKENTGTPAIFSFDYRNNGVTPVTFFPAGQGAWDPAWSPTRDQIAFVSNASGDDEIWVVNRDGSGLKRLTEPNAAYNAREIGKDTFLPEVNEHPSWSPDGSKIVFWTNRNRRREIWVMDADGGNAHRLSAGGAYDDWNPVWVKYTNPAREPMLGIGVK